MDLKMRKLVQLYYMAAQVVLAKAWVLSWSEESIVHVLYSYFRG
jgi:hypothetical protein